MDSGCMGCMGQKAMFGAGRKHMMALFKEIASAKFHSVRRAFHQPVFMGSCLIISHIVCPVYLEDKLFLVFLVLLEEVTTLRWCKPFTSIEVTDGWDLSRVVWILQSRKSKSERNMELCWQTNWDFDYWNQQNVR